MRPPSADPPPPCCLLFVVQSTASMCARLGVAVRGSDRPRKLKAALYVVGRTLRVLLELGARIPAVGAALEAGLLAYRGDGSGGTELLAPLPGTTPEEPFLPLAALAPKDGPAARLATFEAQGACRAADALLFATGAVREWLIRHPGAVRPLVVHVTDGSGCDETLARAVHSLRALAVRGQNVDLYHWVLSETPVPTTSRPGAAADLPAGPWRELWELSSPAGAGTVAGHQPRLLNVNDLSAADIVGRLRPRRDRAAGGPAAPADGWRLGHRVLWVQKGGNAPGEREDAHGVDPARGLAAVSDGAGSGIFSRLWANILTGALLEDGPAPGDPEALARWQEGCRARWLKEINFPALRPTQQHRVRTAGAGATLLALRLGALPAAAGRPDRFAWSAWSVGDSCLFWVRDNRLRATFPAVRSAEFGLCPPLLQTLADRPVLTPLSAGGIGKPGDLFLLATDATAQLLLNRCENEGEPDWGEVWNWDEAAWRDEIVETRRRGDMVDDDCTLMALRLVRGEDGVGQRRRPGRPTQLSSGAGGEPATE